MTVRGKHFVTLKGRNYDNYRIVVEFRSDAEHWNEKFLHNKIVISSVGKTLQIFQVFMTIGII
jgi:hypothetical protein